MAREGKRPIALSRDMVSWSDYAEPGAIPAHTRVWLESTDYPDDPRCNGEFILEDTMNERYRDMGDLFFLDRADNTSCRANVYKLNLNQ